MKDNEVISAIVVARKWKHPGLLTGGEAGKPWHAGLCPSDPVRVREGKLHGSRAAATIGQWPGFNC